MFQLGDSSTVNVSTKPAKFLGKYISGSFSKSQTTSANILKQCILPTMQKIDKATIRGEYKLWIYQHYLAPSLLFFLAVNGISKSQITSIQRHISRYIKLWLNLPRCATLAAIFHPISRWRSSTCHTCRRKPNSPCLIHLNPPLIL